MVELSLTSQFPPLTFQFFPHGTTTWLAALEFRNSLVRETAHAHKVIFHTHEAGLHTCNKQWPHETRSFFCPVYCGWIVYTITCFDAITLILYD